MQTNIGIVVISYHNPEMTKRFVRKELSKLESEYTLVVVNVASNYSDSKKLADECSLTFVDKEDNMDLHLHEGYLIWDKENLGYAKGNNRGTQFLKRIGNFSHFLFSNDDIEIKNSNIIEVLVRSMEKESDIGIIGPRVVTLEGIDQSPHDRYISIYRQIGWRLFSFLRERKNKQLSEKHSLIPSHKTYWVSGAFMLVDATSFFAVRGFDERTFLYYEEAILTERFRRIRKFSYYESSVGVIHFDGSSSKRITKNKKLIELESQFIYYRHYRKYNWFILMIYKVLLKIGREY